MPRCLRRNRQHDFAHPTTQGQMPLVDEAVGASDTDADSDFLGLRRRRA